jgi:peptidyl-tRNA hydrolase
VKITRVVLQEEPYPNCIISGKQLGYFAPVYKIERDDKTVVYVDLQSYLALHRLR